MQDHQLKNLYEILPYSQPWTKPMDKSYSTQIGSQGMGNGLGD